VLGELKKLVRVMEELKQEEIVSVDINIRRTEE